MTTTSDSTAVRELSQALVVRPRDPAELGRWRWMVRQRMVGVRNALTNEPAHPEDGALAARHVAAQRERAALLKRLSQLGPQVLEAPDVEPVATELARLVGDVRHHLQRRTNLAWDDAQLEIGGSE